MTGSHAVLEDAKQRKRDRTRVWMRAYRATPKGRAAIKAAKQKVLTSERGAAVKCAGNKRWKKSENGKQYNRNWARSKYVSQRTRPLLTKEERKERARISNLKSLKRPEYQQKRAATIWRNHLRRHYGITPAEYDRLALQGCHICGSKDSKNGKKRLHVDHCHQTGRIRGILCNPCNHGIGCFQDTPEILEKAISYLRRG